MKSKTLAIAVICSIALASIPVSSVFSSKIDRIEKTQYMVASSNKDETRASYEQMLDKIYNGSDPSKEISEFLSYPEIKQLIREIYGSETLNTIEVLFLEKNRLIKLLKISQYSYDFNKLRRNNTFQEFEAELNTMISSNISSLEDIENIDIISRYNVNAENITKCYSDWEDYLEGHPRFKFAMLNLEINPLTFFAFLIIFLVFFGFAYGGLTMFPSFCQVFPEFLRLVEGAILGVTACFFSTELRLYENHSLIDIFVNLVYSFSPGVVEAYEGGIRAVFAGAIAELVLIGYCLFFDLSRLIRFIGGGLGIVIPAFICALITTLILENIDFDIQSRNGLRRVISFY